MAIGIEITQGTKEIIPVTIVDKTNVTTDLSGMSPKFWFQKPDDTYVYNSATASATGLRIDCLVETSSGGPGGLLALGLYRLYVGWTNGATSEVVKKFAQYVTITLPTV